MATAESGLFLDPNLDGIQGDVPHPTVIEGDQKLDSPPHPRAAKIAPDQLLPGSDIFNQMLKSDVIIDHSPPRINPKPIADTQLKSRSQMDIVYQPRLEKRIFYNQTRWNARQIHSATSRRRI